VVLHEATWRATTCHAGLHMRLLTRRTGPVGSGVCLWSLVCVDSPELARLLPFPPPRHQFDGSTLRAHALDAALGRSGSLHAHGELPLQPLATPTASASDAGLSEDTSRRVEGPGALGPTPRQDEAAERSPGEAGSTDEQPELIVALEGAELRLRGLYSGQLDAGLRLRSSLAAPQLGGQLRLSRGTLYLLPPQADRPATQVRRCQVAASRRLADVAQLLFMLTPQPTPTLRRLRPRRPAGPSTRPSTRPLGALSPQHPPCAPALRC
jgi:hypothetical protein